VEARGVEPLSENIPTKASPGAASVLTFPPPGSLWQDTGFSSFIFSSTSQSFDAQVPCLNDAQIPQRRNCGLDANRLLSG